MANENLKKQMVVKLGTTTNTEAQLISNMVDGALSGKGGNDPELENLKKQMVIKLGTTTNEDAQIISNMVDNAAGGGGGGVEINNPTLTINYHQNGYTNPVMFSRVFNLGESVGYIALQENHLTLNPMLVGEDGTISLYMTSSDTEIMFNPLTTNENATETINCEFAGEGEDHAIIVTDTQENASISISYTPGGIS